jgi:hypothetical protein
LRDFNELLHANPQEIVQYRSISVFFEQRVSLIIYEKTVGFAISWGKRGLKNNSQIGEQK